MGLLRFLFALSVVFAHSPIGALVKTLPLVGGALAVQSFFMISGFYIGMILDGKYHNKFLFWSNRAFRLIPSYWVILLATFIYYLLRNPAYFSAFTPVGIGPKSYIIFSSIFILGQDASLFMGIKDQALYFTSNFIKTDPRLFTFFLTPQAWTLALEFYFYLLAPFLCRLRTSFLIALVVLCLTLRFIAYNSGYDFDPWTYRFFPFELALFLSGVLAYRAYKKFFKDKVVSQKTKLLCSLMLLLTILYPILPDAIVLHTSVKTWTFLVLFFALLPLGFTTFKDNKWDRMVGDLSYPIYVSHYLVIQFLAHFAVMNAHLVLYVCAAIVLTIIVAWMLHKIVEIPVDHYRVQRVKKYNQANLN